MSERFNKSKHLLVSSVELKFYIHRCSRKVISSRRQLRGTIST